MSRRKYILTALLCTVFSGAVFPLQTGKKYNFRFKDGQHLRNATLVEETAKTYRVKLDYISEEKILEKKDLRELPVLAHSLSTLPGPGSSLAFLDRVEITFAEPVNGAENPQNYSVEGAAAGTLKVAGVKRVGAYKYELALTGQAADGNLVIHLVNITDNVGARLNSESIEYRMDVTKPRVEISPTNNSALPSLKEITLQYSEPVRNAEKAVNYLLSGAGSGTLKIKRVSRDANSENRYKLLLNGNLSNGGISLRLKNITDEVGNELESSAFTYTGDITNPSLTALPPAKSLLREFKNMDLSFSEQVVGADRSENYKLSGAGAGSLSVTDIVRLEGNRYRLNFAGSPASGPVSVEIVGVTDVAGNTLTGNTVSYQTDVVKPAFVATPAPGTSVTKLPAVSLSFSKPVTGAQAPENYFLEGEGVGDLALKEIRKAKNNHFELRFSGNPRDGKILLRLKGITDAAGNSLQTDAVEYLADVTPPQFKPSLEPDSLVNTLRDVELQFTEPITGADNVENYLLSGEGAAGLSIDTVQAIAENRYRLSLSGPLRDGRVILKLKNISDRAGNPLRDNSIAYKADVTAPTLSSIVPGENTALHDLDVIQLQFSEPMLGADNAQNYVLDGEGKGSLAITSAMVLPENRVKLTLAGKPGAGKLSLRFNNCTDLAGNLLSVRAVDYRSDTDGPVFEADIAPGKVVSGLKKLTVHFSEAVVGADNAENYRLTGPGTGSLRVTGVRSEKSGFYTLDFSGTPTDGDINLQVMNVADLAGNPLVSDNLAFKADVTQPGFTVQPTGNAPINKLEEIQVTYSEPVSGADRVENHLLRGKGVGSLQIVAIEPLPGNTFRLKLNGTPGNGPVEFLASNITDLAGNELSPRTVAYQADTVAPSYEIFPRPGLIARDFSKLELSYSEAVSGAGDVKNYALTGDGVGNLEIDRVEALPGSKYRLVLKGAPQTGEISLAVNDVSDLAGNAIIRKSVVYHSDTVKPVLVVLPAPESVLNQLSVLKLRFSKPVSGAGEKENYKLKGEGLGSLRIEQINSTEPTEYQLILSGTPANGNVTLELRSVTDAAGNAPDTGSIRYQFDLRPVEVKPTPPVRSTLARLSQVELEFSKPVEGADDAGNYLVSGDFVETLKVSAVEKRGKNKYLLRMAGEAGGGSVRIMLRSITDRAGNTLKNNKLEYVIEIPTASQPCGDIVR